jgi:integrase
MVYPRGKNKVYSYRFMFAGRIIHESAKTTSKTVAREAERARRRQLEESYNHVAKRKLPPSFEKAANEWMASRKGTVAPKTLSIGDQALKHLLPVFGQKLLCDITAKHVKAYQSARRSEGMEGRTVNIEVGVLRQVLDADGFWRALEPDVTFLKENSDVGRALSRNEEARLLAECLKADSACYTAVVMALNTTMRKDELCKLQWLQVDWMNRTLIVGESKTEAGEGRVIPLNPDAFKALLAWKAQFPDSKPDHYIFPFCEHNHIDPTRPTKGWRTAWENSLKRSGVKCRFHDLRHTCISRLAEGQASDQTIMSIAGHVSRKMLERYSHIRIEAKRRALDGLNHTELVSENGQCSKSDALETSPGVPADSVFHTRVALNKSKETDFQAGCNQNCNQVEEPKNVTVGKLFIQ